MVSQNSDSTRESLPATNNTECNLVFLWTKEMGLTSYLKILFFPLTTVWEFMNGLSASPNTLNYISDFKVLLLCTV